MFSNSIFIVRGKGITTSFLRAGFDECHVEGGPTLFVRSSPAHIHIGPTFFVRSSPAHIDMVSP